MKVESRREFILNQIQSSTEPRPLTALLKGKPEMIIMTSSQLKKDLREFETTRGMCSGDFIQSYMLGLTENFPSCTTR